MRCRFRRQKIEKIVGQKRRRKNATLSGRQSVAQECRETAPHHHGAFLLNLCLDWMRSRIVSDHRFGGKFCAWCDLSICHAKLLVLVIKRLAVIGIGGDVERSYGSKGRAAILSCMITSVVLTALRWRFLRRHIDESRIVEDIGIVEAMRDFVLNVKALHLAAISFRLRVLTDVTELHLAECIFLRAR